MEKKNSNETHLTLFTPGMPCYASMYERQTAIDTCLFITVFVTNEQIYPQACNYSAVLICLRFSGPMYLIIGA